MFEREHHRQVAAVLESLDAGLLSEHGCFFGGGTAIVLAHGEYRESADIDFMVSSRSGYRALRELVTGPRGLGALARPGRRIDEARDLRADQYGLRTRVRSLGAEIKLEIVFEARIDLEQPGSRDRLCGVATLTPVDLAATKLLANSDRWADDSVQSRDLIDLAMMALPKSLLAQAKGKARGA
ncbi:MAG: nucleotidyl transferase AbiEii/AbiGii toxin family protein, partial [Deltaproteobacteria bacterium]|nr:nucleotidyl transferase AbiEii/AbiGii toxin family protein [Deltaproteobacteria bacterium]